MTRKRSFFEKLTGSIKMEEDHSPEMEEDIASHDEEEVPPPEEDNDEIGELAVDVYATKDAIVIQAMTAGVKKSDLDIRITRDQVSITGERHADARVHDHNYYYAELYWGPFTRAIDLPEEVEVEEAHAKEEHGLLTITLPKIDKNKEARLKVS